MKKILFSYYLLLVVFFASAGLLIGEEHNYDTGSVKMVFEESSIGTTESNIFDKDYFFGGKSLDFSGVADDLYLMGSSIDFSGESNGSAMIFAESVHISGIVGNNLHSAGNSVRITGHINDSAFIGAEDLVIAEGAVIDGTLFSGSNTLTILGQLNNGLIAGSGEIIIDGPINGNVNVKTGKLIITERGSIRGNLTYGAHREISEKEKNNITGFVKYEIKEKINKDEFSTFFLVVKIISALTLLISGLLILLLPGVKSLFTKKREKSSYGKTILWGLIPLFIYPVVVLVTLPLFPLSIALGLASFPFLFLSIILGLSFLGQLLFKVFKWEKDNIFLQFMFAFGVYTVLALIPFVCIPLVLGVAAAGSGLMIGKLFKSEF